MQEWYQVAKQLRGIQFKERGKECPSEFKMLISCKDGFGTPGNGLEKQESVDIESGELMRQKKMEVLNEHLPQREEVGMA